MKQPWQRCCEYCPPAVSTEQHEAIQWVRDRLAELGLANLTAELLVRDLAEMVRAGGMNSDEYSGRSTAQMPASISCQILVPFGRDAPADAIPDWSYFLVMGPACRPDQGKNEGRRVIQVFLHPAAWREPETEAHRE